MLALALLAARPLRAEEPARRPPQPVKAEFITEHASIRPGGQTRVAIRFELEPKWHIYAQDPGDAGLPTKIAWSGPDGTQFGPLIWPRPQTFTDPGDIKTNGYTGTLVLSSTLTLQPGRTWTGAVPLKANVSWLACKELCIPGSAMLKKTLLLSPEPPTPSADAKFFKPAA